ncbi:hypothetical protein BDW22DRAFT_1337561 [Trametopsis cervina]|nr:hypothetical protein BDW22DRAFT_1337561 [Trametopsis cervina]
MPSSLTPFTIDPQPAYGDIILSLHFRGGNSLPFHWIIYTHNTNVTSGTKMHAISLHSHWRFQATPFDLPYSISTAVGVTIGRLRRHTTEDVISLLSRIPMSVPDVDRDREPVFDCRVWCREALRQLHAAGIIYCPDVDAMETEIEQYGNMAAHASESGTFRMAILRPAVNSR